MSAKSEGEELLYFQMKSIFKSLPERQYKFAEKRRWAADFAFPHLKLLIEVEGGTWSGGRHTTGTGFRNDCEKYNAAACLGFHVLRFTTDMVKSGEALKTIEAYLDAGQ